MFRKETLRVELDTMERAMNMGQPHDQIVPAGCRYHKIAALMLNDQGMVPGT